MYIQHKVKVLKTKHSKKCAQDKNTHDFSIQNTDGTAFSYKTFLLNHINS